MLKKINAIQTNQKISKERRKSMKKSLIKLAIVIVLSGLLLGWPPHTGVCIVGIILAYIAT